ncbi:hypothetical protein [Fredinandcohnia quinoae]|uniref:Beta-carotene 15,15'-monooxygenase n=1 Tax=Fredinandcohnia quinoae TaxID=2918902 RepID=A0AAW5EDD5_9BACI|nr:hypothetical protein [Fredinandcohnia sp. SECRCQ15]MCH1627153.1 hypothetical protein [Fredinandcohnia sp. SECRCQ15]
MVHTVKTNKSAYIFGLLAILILAGNYSVMSFEAFTPVTDMMILATILDLTIVLPILFYIFIVRNRFSLITILPVPIAGFWLAYFIVPHHELPIFDYVKYSIFALEGVFIAIELTLAIFLLRKIPALLKNYKIQSEIDFYYPTMLRNAFNKTFGTRKITEFLILDFSVIYFGLFAWKKKWQQLDHAATSFSIHKKSGYFGLFIVIAHAMVIEVIGVHFLILQWSTVAAWIFTVLDIYALIWIIADYQAVRLSPIVMTKEKMFVQIGIRRGIEIDFSTIKSIDSTRTDKKIRGLEKNSFSITLPDLIEEEPQFEMELKEPAIARLPFGKKREITKLYVTVDEKEKFYQLVQEMIADEELTLTQK